MHVNLYAAQDDSRTLMLSITVPIVTECLRGEETHEQQISVVLTGREVVGSISVILVHMRAAVHIVWKVVHVLGHRLTHPPVPVAVHEER